MTRYALYFTPLPDSMWWKAGCQWVGRDPASGAEYAQPAIAGLPHLLLPKLTSDVRRYGFHATLKAPFRLENGFTETHLLAMAQAFCALQRPLALAPMMVGKLGASLALQLAQPDAEVDALALRCTRYFDLLRAVPVEEERKKYRDKDLSAHQKNLLRRWGYPYTEDEFRFHLTLTDSLGDVPQESAAAIAAAAQAHFARVQAHGPLRIAGLTILRENQPGSPFMVWQRIAFNEHVAQVMQPRPGRLFYCVGAPGAGREALLGWVREHLPSGRDIVFAQRTITRPAQAGEPHEPVDETSFLQLAQDGYFSMHWRANGLCYGIRRNIEVDLAIGRDVIVNGVPGNVPQLLKAFPDAHVIRLDGNQSDPFESAVVIDGTRHPERHITIPRDADSGALDSIGPIQAAGQRLLDILARRE
jgi:phosphonate metabolism protein PhnN/1,5-bisphosphokinase (PRPP-forming)